MKNNRGVTVAVLIITILVALILTAVSIKFAVNADRTAKVSEMNQDAIDYANSAESSAMKEKYNEFVVEELKDIDGIQICTYEEDYGYVPSVIPRDDSKKVFFMAKTEDNQDAQFFVDGQFVDNDYMWQYYDNNANTTSSGTSNIIGIDSNYFIGLLKENGSMTIEAKISGGKTYLLEILYSKNTYKDISINSNANQVRYNDEGAEIIAETEYNIYQELDKHGEENLNVSKYTTISDKAGKYGNIVKKTGNALLIKGKASSVDMYGNPEDDVKLYSVLEKTEENNVKLYLDDYDLVFYNPIEEIEVSPIVITEELYNFITEAEVTLDEDLETTTILRLANEMGMVALGLDFARDFNGLTMEELGEKMDFSFDTDQYGSIEVKYDFTYDTGNASIKASRIEKDFSKEDIETETRKYVKINFEDFNGNITSVPTYFDIKEDLGDVFVADSTGEISNKNFEIYANNNPSSKYYEPTFERAFMRASEYDGAVTIKQNISAYRIDEGYSNNLLKVGEIIDSNDENFEDDDSGINLTIDLNGNTLKIKEGTTLIIGTNSNVTIKSTEDYENNDEISGKLQFSFSKEEEQQITITDFLSDPRNSYYLSFEKWCKHEGISIDWWKIVTKTETYKQYVNAVQTAYNDYYNDSSQRLLIFAEDDPRCAIANFGTLNFESGKIEADCNYVTNISVINGGGDVLENTVAATNQFFKKLGITVDSGVRNDVNRAVLSNQIMGIVNNGNLTFGKTTSAGITESTDEHPELVIYSYSKNNAVGTILGKYDVPNFLVNYNIAVITDEGASTIVNSGFIENGAYNSIKNWWSIVAGNYFAEFVNLGGTLQINGLTKKTITEEDSVLRPSISRINDNSIFQKVRNGSFVFLRLQTDAKSEGTLNNTKNYVILNAGNGGVSVAANVLQYLSSNYSIKNMVELVGDTINDSSKLGNTSQLYKYSDTVESYIETDWSISVDGMNSNTLKNYNGTVVDKIVSNINSLIETLYVEI